MADKVGYDVESVDILNQNFNCQICMFIIRDPVQLSECGHGFCKLCMDGYMKE